MNTSKEERKICREVGVQQTYGRTRKGSSLMSKPRKDTQICMRYREDVARTRHHVRTLEDGNSSRAERKNKEAVREAGRRNGRRASRKTGE